MSCLRLLFPVLFALACVHGEACAGDMASFLSGKVRELDARLGKIEQELTSLPKLVGKNQGSHYGFRSETLAHQASTDWVQIDLGSLREIDGFVLMPAYVPRLGDGFCFPLRFKIEVADDEEMTQAAVAVDRTQSDVVSPGIYPLIVREEPVSGRYVRFSSTKHLPKEGGFIWALEELMVLSGNSNIAAGRPCQSSSSLELEPNWSLRMLNDGMSRLGEPVDSLLPTSNTRGYLSAPASNPRAEKWFFVDLLKECKVDEVRLVAAVGRAPEIFRGLAYPQRLSLELSLDADFHAERVRRFTLGETPLGYPFYSAVVTPCDAAPARYVRVLADELRPNEGQNHFALAEVQIYSGGKNVALHKPVHALDQASPDAGSDWSAGFVVDGFTSKRQLIEWPEFLTMIDRRHSLADERGRIESERAERVSRIHTATVATSSGLGGAALLGCVWMYIRQRYVRKRDAIQLREQISRDLHDDIGSNLGSILLQCQLGASLEGMPDEVREEFNEIRATAEQTSEAMRDIVWLIDVRSGDLWELIIKMRDVCERLLGDIPTGIEVNPTGFRNRSLTLLFRRHVLLAFKETLNNIRKHADAGTVAISVDITATGLTFMVRDDGCGFAANSAAGRVGHGLENLQRRASRLKGSCTIDSTFRSNFND
jgi:signal transduction histidine kinase